jgi:hypothetical protein
MDIHPGHIITWAGFATCLVVLMAMETPDIVFSVREIMYRGASIIVLLFLGILLIVLGRYVEIYL